MLKDKEAEERAEEIYLFFDQFPNMNKSDVKAASLFVVKEIKKAIGWDQLEEGVDRDDYWDIIEEKLEKS